MCYDLSIQKTFAFRLYAGIAFTMIEAISVIVCSFGYKWNLLFPLSINISTENALCFRSEFIWLVALRFLARSIFRKNNVWFHAAAFTTHKHNTHTNNIVFAIFRLFILVDGKNTVKW